VIFSHFLHLLDASEPLLRPISGDLLMINQPPSAS